MLSPKSLLIALLYISSSAFCQKTELLAIEDFEMVKSEKYVPFYKDNNRNALAINAAKFQGVYTAAKTRFDLEKGMYNIRVTSLTETDGESSYQLYINNELIGEFQNPLTEVDYAPHYHIFKELKLKKGDEIRIAFNSHSNGKIPEGDAFAFSRGRWRSLEFLILE